MLDLSVALVFSAIGLGVTFVPRGFLVHRRAGRVAVRIESSQPKRFGPADRST